jgi:choline dehydrogenase-like flavoprotein
MRTSTAAILIGCLSSRCLTHQKSQRSSDWESQQWDAIVVGAGTAGIIVADRLSEAGKNTLLLELGGPSYGITGGTERPGWLNGTNLSRVDVPGLCTTHPLYNLAEFTLMRHQTRASLLATRNCYALPML